jgi:hypothetical protein
MSSGFRVWRTPAIEIALRSKTASAAGFRKVK